MNTRIARTLAIACALAGVSASAHAAQATATFYNGDCAAIDGAWMCPSVQGGGTLQFSDLLTGALNTASITVTEVAPGIIVEGDTLSVAAPVQAVSGIFDTDTSQFTALKVRTLGGATLTASAVLPNGRKNIATTGGSLTLTNIQVDLSTKDIYATLTGANGVGMRTNQLIWQYGTISGPTSFVISSSTGIRLDNQLSQLTISAQAFNLFAQSLGLTDFGKDAMAQITDYGVMASVIEIGTPVPEPGTYLLMGMGLVGLILAASRRPMAPALAVTS